MQLDSNGVTPEPKEKLQPARRKRSHASDEFSAQFGAEGLSLKVALPKWAKTVLAVLLAVGLLKSVVVVKAIEIHDRYQQSQIAHNKLVKELAEQIQKEEKKRREAEQESEGAIHMRLFQYHLRQDPKEERVVALPSGNVRLRVYANSDVLVTRELVGGLVQASWLQAPQSIEQNSP